MCVRFIVQSAHALVSIIEPVNEPFEHRSPGLVLSAVVGDSDSVLQFTTPRRACLVQFVLIYLDGPGRGFWHVVHFRNVMFTWCAHA